MNEELGTVDCDCCCLVNDDDIVLSSKRLVFLALDIYLQRNEINIYYGLRRVLGFFGALFSYESEYIL